MNLRKVVDNTRVMCNNRNMGTNNNTNKTTEQLVEEYRVALLTWRLENDQNAYEASCYLMDEIGNRDGELVDEFFTRLMHQFDDDSLAARKAASR